MPDFALLNPPLLLAGSMGLAVSGIAAAEPVDFFENKVRPLLVEHCYSCHSAEAEAKGKLKAGLRMDSLQGLKKGGDSGPVLTPGDPAKSLLVEAVHYRNEDMAMPPKAKLHDAQIQVLTEWVQMGAPWPGSDGHGGFGDTDPLPNAWRYRDWVVAALNSDMPYDQFVTRQIAGDALKENPDPVATGFFVVGPTYRDDGGDPEARAVFEAAQAAIREQDKRVHDFVHAAAQRLDKKPEEVKLHATYQRLYSRAPEPSEVDLGAQWLGMNPAPERWHRYAQVLLSAHELIQIQ